MAKTKTLSKKSLKDDGEIPQLVDTTEAAENTTTKDIRPLSRKERRKEKKKLLKQLQENKEPENEIETEDEEETPTFDMEAIDRSDSESEFESESDEESNSEPGSESDEEEVEGEDDEAEEEKDDENSADTKTKRKQINNIKALKKSLDSIRLPYKKLAFHEFNMLPSSIDTSTEITDPNEEMQRELVFYKQGLEAVEIAKKQYLRAKIPFSRPLDYFAEMVKSDEHMDKLKKKLIEEATARKASQEARKQRELKKFGKQKQVSRMQEHQKEKRDTLDKIKSLKRKRQNNEITGEQFDIELEETTSDKKADKKKKSNPNRHEKDSKQAKKRGSDVSSKPSRKIKGTKPRSRRGK